MKNTIKYIRNHFEWSMGCGGKINKGQCPICCGVSKAWIDGYGGWGTKFGHKPGCKLGMALELDGETVVWEKS